MGKQYLLGYGVSRDHRSAVYYFVRSSAQGMVEAGVTLVVSAGNNDATVNACDRSPAGSPYAITVGLL